MDRRRIVPFALGAVLLAACSNKKPPTTTEEKIEPLKELSAKKVSVDLATPDPGAAYWQDVPAGAATLAAQPMITPRPSISFTEKLIIQAIHDGTRVAFRLRWKDTEKSEAGHLGEYSDAAALQFPVKDGPPPLVMMGQKDGPVHIFHWRAQYQRDEEKGKPDMKDLYPNASVDMYPLEFKEAKALNANASETEKFSPGVAEGNPQSYVKKGVDEIIAEGFSTSSVQKGHGSAAKGEWKDGTWTLVVSRPLAIEGGSTLRPGAKGNVAFAVWQGGKGEVGSRKCVTMFWTPVSIL